MNKFIKILVVCSLALSNLALAQTDIKTNKLMDKKWNEVDSLVNKVRKPESAKKVVQSILELAIKNNETDQKIKAEAWLIALKDNEEDSELTQYKLYQEKIANSKDFVEKAIWQNRAAEVLYSYFNNNSYQLYDRTTLLGDTSSDISTWDAKRFHKEIAALYLASVEQRVKLREVPVSKYNAIITEGKNTPGLNTTIYDLLVSDAIDYFEDDEKDVASPEIKFSLDNNSYFNDVQEFVNLKIATKDSSSLKYNALKLYQEVLKYHLETKNANAIISLDKNRLEFVYENSVLSDKNSLYENALANLAAKYKENPLAGEALYSAVENKYDRNYPQKYNRYRNDTKPIAPSDYTLLNYLHDLEKITNTYPKSNAAIDAENAISRLKAVSISVDLEDAYLPNENIKLLFSYNNLKQVKISIYETTLLQIENVNYKGKLVKTWTQNLVKAEDLAKHSVELKVDPLPIGLYKIVFEDENSEIKVEQLLQVSHLSAVNTSSKDQNKTWIVLNRKDGKTVSVPTLIYLKYNYDVSAPPTTSFHFR